MAPGAFDIALHFCGGLALFLYGMTVLGRGLETAAGSRAEAFLERCTRTRWTAMMTGIAATVLLDSSSVVIIILIALVGAGLIGFEQSLGVILGANIGTTVSSQILAFDVERYAPLLLMAGLLLNMFGRRETARNIGLAGLGMGLLFFGMQEMADATIPLRTNPATLEWIRRLEHPVAGAAAGALFTAIIQSSSAMMGIVIAMATSGVMSLKAGVALMFGAEIGTCADTLIASAGRSRGAVRVGVFHLVFNVVSVAAGLLLAAPFLTAVVALSGGAPVARQLANAHVLFNVLGALAFLPLLPAVSRGLRLAIPEHPRVLTETAVAAPV